MKVEKRKKIIGWTVAVIYMAVLLRLTVFRSDIFENDLFVNGCVHYLPLDNYIEILQDRQYFVFLYLFVGNIIWFMPFGFLLPFLTGRPKTVPMIVVFGFLLSFVIEFSQFAFGTGDSELDDLVLNTLGALLGFLIYRVYLRRKMKAGTRESGDHDDAQN